MGEQPRDPRLDPNATAGPREDAQQTRRAELSPLLDIEDFRPLSTSVRVTIGARSHPGVLRHSNEDHYLVLRVGRNQETLATSLSRSDVPAAFEESGYAMLVADGLGEGGSGSVASRVALSTIAHLALHYGRWNVRVDAATASEIFERAEWFYSQADAAVHTRAASSAVLKEHDDGLTVVRTGDDCSSRTCHSRAYLFRDGALTLLTRDHTVERHLAETHRPTSVERRAGTCATS